MAYPNRTFCDTISEMRKLVSSMSIFSYIRNKAILQSLIEECQTYGNRMEAALYYQRDIDKLHKKKSELEKEVAQLNKQLGKDVRKSNLDQLLSE